MKRKVKCLIGAMVMLSFFFIRPSNAYAQEEADSFHVLPNPNGKHYTV